MPELILTEESAKGAIGSPPEVKIDRGLLLQVLIGQHEQSKGSQRTTPGSTTAFAAVVTHVGLDGRFQGR